MLVDSHVHLDAKAFDDDRDAVISRARQSGVDLMLEIAGSDVGEGSLDRGIKLADDFDFIYAAVGLHPHEASIFNKELEQRMITLSSHPKVVAWGEIGLDYHYNYSPPEVQRNVFKRQLEIAADRSLPAIIHTREAEDDTIEILSEFSSLFSGVMHCFTGSKKLAQAALDLGFYISFSGVLTFKNAGELREIATEAPIDRILVETDCPYLAPVPHRGKRNEPAFVVDTANEIARLRSTSFETIADATTANFQRLFGIKSSL